MKADRTYQQWRKRFAFDHRFRRPASHFCDQIIVVYQLSFEVVGVIQRTPSSWLPIMKNFPADLKRDQLFTANHRTFAFGARHRVWIVPRVFCHCLSFLEADHEQVVLRIQREFHIELLAAHSWPINVLPKLSICIRGHFSKSDRTIAWMTATTPLSSIPRSSALCLRRTRGLELQGQRRPP